jgi:hypothetical protein
MQKHTVYLQPPRGAGLHIIQEGYKNPIAAAQQPTVQTVHKFRNQQMINKLKHERSCKKKKKMIKRKGRKAHILAFGKFFLFACILQMSIQYSNKIL